MLIKKNQETTGISGNTENVCKRKCRNSAYVTSKKLKSENDEIGSIAKTLELPMIIEHEFQKIGKIEVFF